jgi:hypothetical protein
MTGRIAVATKGNQSATDCPICNVSGCRGLEAHDIPQILCEIHATAENAISMCECSPAAESAFRAIMRLSSQYADASHAAQ